MQVCCPDFVRLAIKTRGFRHLLACATGGVNFSFWSSIHNNCIKEKMPISCRQFADILPTYEGSGGIVADILPTFCRREENQIQKHHYKGTMGMFTVGYAFCNMPVPKVPPLKLVYGLLSCCIGHIGVVFYWHKANFMECRFQPRSSSRYLVSISY